MNEIIKQRLYDIIIDFYLWALSPIGILIIFTIIILTIVLLIR